MENIITDLKLSKRRQGGVNVYLDHCFAFTVDLLEAAALSKGQALDAGFVTRMRRKHEGHSAYVCALRYLSHRMRSRKEIDRYLCERRGFARETTASVVKRLTQERYLDDKEFARLFVESRIRSRPRSRALLRHELSQKGIDDDVIVAVLEKVDDAYLAWRSIEGKLKQWVELDRADFKKRIVGFLQRRGFPLSIALDTYHRARSQTIRDEGTRRNGGSNEPIT